MRHLSFYLVCLLIGLVAHPRISEAFEVRPAIFDLSLPSGSSTERELRIRNTDADPLTVFFTIQKFVPAGGGQPRFLDPMDADGLPRWVRVSEPELLLKPGEERLVRVRVDVPKGERSGGAYAGLFATEKPALGSPVGIGRRIATLLLVSVDGERRPPRLRLLKNGLRDGAEGGVYEVTWKNEGGTHGLVDLRLEARRMTLFGPRRSVEEMQMRLLPGEERTVRLEWDDRTPASWVQARALVDGKIVNESAAMTWWVHPVFIGVGGVLLVTVIAMIRRRRRQKQKGGFLGV